MGLGSLLTGLCVSWTFCSPGEIPKKNISRIAEKSRIVTEHRAGAPCEPCAPSPHSAQYTIEQGHPQGHSQAVAGRRKRLAQRKLYSSSQHSRLTDPAETNTKSTAIFMSRRALSRQKSSSRGTARHTRFSGSQGTVSGTIHRTACSRAAGFDDSIRWTSVATS